jgi:hypothetical protein
MRAESLLLPLFLLLAFLLLLVCFCAAVSAVAAVHQMLAALRFKAACGVIVWANDQRPPAASLREHRKHGTSF